MAGRKKRETEAAAEDSPTVTLTVGKASEETEAANEPEPTEVTAEATKEPEPEPALEPKPEAKPAPAKEFTLILTGAGSYTNLGLGISVKRKGDKITVGREAARALLATGYFKRVR